MLFRWILDDLAGFSKVASGAPPVAEAGGDLWGVVAFAFAGDAFAEPGAPGGGGGGGGKAAGISTEAWNN